MHSCTISVVMSLSRVFRWGKEMEPCPIHVLISLV